MAITNKVRECRFFANEMTQQTLAEAVEKNKYNPSLEVAFKIAKLFNKSVEEVFAYFPDD